MCDKDRTKPSFYDHLIFLDSKIYVYNEVLGQVVEHSESVRFEKVLKHRSEIILVARYGDMMSRPGSMMMGGGIGGYMPMSRSTSF